MTTTATLPKSYSPVESEGPVSRRWEESDVFHAEPGAGDPYCILIPPPNVTAALHLGHAFNNTLQDVLIRYHRMRGFNTLWMPGTDHAGIATQTVVEKRLLQQEGRRRTDFQRDEFVARVQAWKDEYEATITEQLKALGCSCDWARQRFTMDPMCAAAVREAFYRLFRDGLIYRGKRLVNWDPVTLTALSDDEVEMPEVAGHMWYLRYPLVDGGAGLTHVTVATTRPETMLGDTAVAVNPRDPRAAALRGCMVRLPIVDRVVPIIEDDYVVMTGTDDPKSEYATGFLKVTPAHDPNDWEIGLRHELAVINVMAPDATISAEHGWSEVSDDWQTADVAPLLGLSREEARQKVVDWFRDHGLLENVRDYGHSVGHSYRSHVPIEPYLSDQWYVAVTDDRMKGEALRALSAEQYEGAPPAREGGSRTGDGELSFFPSRYARSYQAWHENLRDWCVSRQLWWGHRIPVWCPEATPSPEIAAQVAAWEQEERVALRTRDGSAPGPDTDPADVFVCVRGRDDQEIVTYLEGHGFGQDPDVLDTWFSSGLWPISIMGWPDPAAFPEAAGLLETFNPSSVLCTGRDIITLWVSRMVMFNRYFRDGTLPYRHVYINPMIQDGHGQRMSKSLGNGVDPRDIVHSHGADAARFTLVAIATSTQDVRMPVDMMCPHCHRTVHPTEITSPSGYRVAAPRQECPSCGKSMMSVYAIASGIAQPDAETPLARNTSSKFDEGRNFANKLWNATRFALGNLTAPAGAGPPRDTWSDTLALADRWIITRLHRTVHAAEKAIAAYEFNVYADTMYDFVWRGFCDWYLEAIKPTVRDDPHQQQVLRTVLDATLRLLHPICPFVTETLWPHVAASGPAGLDGIELPDSELLAAAAWPRIACAVDDEEARATFERVQGLIDSIRSVRGSSRKPVRLIAPAPIRALVDAAPQVVAALAGVEIVLEPGPDRPAAAVPQAFEGHEILLDGLRDEAELGAERERLTRLVQEKQRAIEGFRKKLDNPRYVDKAPAAVVQETRDKLAEAESDLATAESALQSMPDD